MREREIEGEERRKRRGDAATPTPLPPLSLHSQTVPSRPFQLPSNPSSGSLFTG